MSAVRATSHKAVRDLRRQRAQVVAVAVTILLGVALYIASAGAFRNLSGSYAHTYDRLHFADLVATGGDAADVAAAARSAGAAGTTARTQIDPPLLIGGTKLLGRVVGLPGTDRPAVDDVDVREGEYLSSAAPDGVLVERHAADTFGLHVGDRVRVFAAGGWHPVTVRGVAVSAEYLWPARSRQEVLSDPHAFAVLFVPQQVVERWSATGPNQTLVTLPPAASPQRAAAVARAMRDAGAVDVSTRADQPSNAALHEDLAGFDELSVAFPLLFLTAAAVASYVLLARRVLAERPIIGTLMASGARRGRLVRHYLLQGLLIGLIGAVTGVVLGVLATGLLTRGYTDALGIPDTIVSGHPELAVIGLAFGVVVGLSGAAAPALAAARTVPADAMRNATASRLPGRWSRFVARLARLPVSTRMALRDVFRSRRRTAATMLGTVLALILVLASVGMLTSLSDALDEQFDQIQRQDATVTADVSTNDPAHGPAHDPAHDIVRQLRSAHGVAAVESTRTGPVTAAHGGHSYATTLSGFKPNTSMHGFRTTDGGWTDLPPDGVLAGAGLADQLDVAVGDTIVLRTEHGIARVRLAGLLDEPMGTAIYATNDVAASALPDAGTATYLIRFAGDVDRDTMRQRITRLSGVVAYADSHAVVASVDQYLGLLWAFIGIMIVLGGILAFAVIYVTMAVNVVERTNELATLRTAGVPLRRVASTLATENLLATILGLPLGLLLGVLAARGFLDSFASDLFHFDLRLGWWALPAAAIGVLAAATLSQWPATRAIRRMDIARVVRERAT